MQLPAVGIAPQRGCQSRSLSPLPSPLVPSIPPSPFAAMWCRSRAPSACPSVWQGCQGGGLLGLQQCPLSCWARARQRLVWTSTLAPRSSHHPLPAFAWEPGELRAVSSSQGGFLSDRLLRPLPLTVLLDASVRARHCPPGIGSWLPWPHRPRACPLSSATGPVQSLRQAGHQKPLPPHVPTEGPQQPSPAEPVSCSGAPETSWHLRPSLSKSREGRRGPGRLGGTGERILVRRLRPSRGGPSPSSRCACLPAPTPPPGHTHPERPQHLRGQQVQGGRGRGQALYPGPWVWG